MPVSRFGKSTQNIARGYHVYLFLNLVVTGIILTQTGRDWGFGDWLINYQGGFVRRGLIGEVLLFLGRITHLNLLYFAAIIGIACYAMLFACVWRMVAESSWRWWVVALLVSPVTLAFQAISRTSYRKEVLFFGAFALLLDWLRRTRNKPQNDFLLSACLSVAFVALTLTHEAMVVYFPYFAAALLIGMQQPMRVVRILAVPALLCGLSFLTVLHYTGDTATVTGICASLGDARLDHCSGAVQFLLWTKDYARFRVASFITESHYYRNYAIILFLALIPIVGGLRDLWRRVEARKALYFLAAAICVAVPPSIGLFIYGFDWGRWIYIHVMSITLILLFIDQRTPSVEGVPFKQKALGSRVAIVALLVVYATCWSMPGFGDSPRFGYLSLANRVLRMHAAASGQSIDTNN